MAEGAGSEIRSRTLRAVRHPHGPGVPGGPVADWDFTSPEPFVDRAGRVPSLRVASGGTPPHRVSDPVVGHAIAFAGDGGHLVIPAADAAPLDFAVAGEVTVMALVRRDTAGTGFIAGLWQEHDDDPRRQYGLFLDLPTYGGAAQVAAHVSATGGASPGLPYSRDYAASARMVRPGVWRVVGMRYDGRFASAVLDGLIDPRSDFTEQGPPLGAGLTVAKNPYAYADGLSHGHRSDFTVGAVLLSSGVGNAFAGRIARLAVWDRALGDGEVMTVTHEWTSPGEPMARFDWWRPDPAPGPFEGGAAGDEWPLESAGMRVAEGAPEGLRVEPSRLVRAARADRVVAVADTPGLTRGMLRAVGVEVAADGSPIDLVVRAGGVDWHARVGAGASCVALDEPRWVAAGRAEPTRVDVPASAPVDAVGVVLHPGAAVVLGELTLWRHPDPSPNPEENA